MLRKISLILIGLVVSLVLGSRVISDEPLIVTPMSLDLTIASGRLDTAYLAVVNQSDSSMAVKSDFDSQWMLIFPSEFKIPSGEAKKVLAIFFIRREEDPQRNGEIVFRTKDGNKQARVKVAISTPTIRPIAEEEETKIEELKKEIRAKSEKIEQLKKEIEEMKFSYEEIVKSLRDEVQFLQRELQKKELEIAALSKPSQQYIGGGGKSPEEKRIEEMGHLSELLAKNLTGELKRNEVQLAWLGDNLLMTIPGQIAFDSGQIYLKSKGLAVLEKIGVILKEKANPHQQIIIQGHADTIPMGNHLKKKFPSNWELSAARAATVVKILQWRIGIDSQSLSVTGCSFYSPLASNTNYLGRAKNRRIEIIVSAKGGER